MHRVGFEPTRFATVVLETTPLDHSGTDAHSLCRKRKVFRTEKQECVKNHVCQCVCWCVCRRGLNRTRKGWEEKSK